LKLAIEWRVSNERVLHGLVRRPSLDRVDFEQAVQKVHKRESIGTLALHVFGHLDRRRHWIAHHVVAQRNILKVALCLLGRNTLLARILDGALDLVVIVLLMLLMLMKAMATICVRMKVLPRKCIAQLMLLDGTQTPLVVLVRRFAGGKQRRWRLAANFDDAAQLVELRVARKYGQAKKELGGDAAKRPNIDHGRVRHA
jgi:hypothetical protein